MKEQSSNEMEVWIFDVKRNAQVRRGRILEEKIAKLKEDSVVDLDLDYLAPYLERIPEGETLTKAKALEVCQYLY